MIQGLFQKVVSYVMEHTKSLGQEYCHKFKASLGSIASFSLATCNVRHLKKNTVQNLSVISCPRYPENSP